MSTEEPTRRPDRRNTDAAYPSGPGSDAAEGLVDGVINPMVLAWRRLRARSSTPQG